jgi:hypothetical protein
MVMVAQAIPQNDYLVHVHPDHHSRIAAQIRSVRHLPLPHATYPPPPVNDPAGGTIFDSTLDVDPRFAWAAFCAAMMVYTIIDMLYLTSALIGRILLRQPAWRWPPIFERPWTSTSLADL